MEKQPTHAPLDPYYEWLGIPPKDQPPNHYRLLGIERFEANANVIQRAADRQMAHLRTFQAGPHSPLSQKLLNEVAAAQLCLLKPEKKAAYDAQLRAQLELATQQASAGPSARPSVFSPVILGSLIAAAGVVVLLVGLFAFRSADSELPQPDTVVHQMATPEPDAPVPTALPTESATPIAAPVSTSPEAAIATTAPATQAATSEPARPKAALPERLTNSIGMELVLIPRGQFMMGAGREDIEEAIEYCRQRYNSASHAATEKKLLAEGPQTQVVIRNAYYLGVCEVTQAQYQAVMGANPSEFAQSPDAPTLPVESVSWNDAVEFCKRLSDTPEERGAGRTYRLPCEAEWEYACRAPSLGKVEPKGWGPAFNRSTWFGTGAGRIAHPVGTKEPNGWGLFDMQGNVAEWCAHGPEVDRFAQLAPSFPTTEIEDRRALRGGSWNDSSLVCRSTWRNDQPAKTRKAWLGFRVAFTPEGADSAPVEPRAVATVADASNPAAAPSSAPDAPKADESMSESVREESVPAASSSEPGAEKPNTPLSPAASALAQKSEPPPAEAQEPLRKQTHKSYHVDQAKTAQAQTELARRMLADAEKLSAKPDERFVLLLCAGELAAAAGDVDLMFNIADQLNASFVIDVLLIERDLWKSQADAATDAKRIESLVMAADRLLDEALVTDRLDLLQELDALLGKVWSRQAAKDFRTQIRDRRERLDRLRRYATEVRQAQAALQKSPDDAQAHTTLGRWYGLLLVDWDRGLPHLAQGNDELAKAAAEAELRLTTSAAALPSGEDLANLANFWWNYAQKAGVMFREPATQRAAHWYQEALGLLEPGAQRSAVEKRLTQLEKGTRTARPTALPKEFANSLGMRFVLMPAGQFLMGTSPKGIEAALKHCREHYVKTAQERTAKRILAEGPQKPVTIQTPFYLGVVEVTQAQYQSVMGNNPSRFSKSDRAQTLPVENVTWNDAVEFCQRLSALPGERLYRRLYRLPCEAEWEYACRAGQPGDANSHGTARNDAWDESNADRSTRPVGTKPANPWGLFDMRGNVAEWCANGPDDHRYSQISPLRIPRHTEGPRAIRNGGYTDGSLTCRQASWRSAPADTRSAGVGFRVVAAFGQAGAAHPIATRSPSPAATVPATSPTPRAATGAKSEPNSSTSLINSIGMQFRLVPSGEFQMGASPEELDKALELFRRAYAKATGLEARIRSETPQALVTIDSAFYLGVCEVTQAEFQKVMGFNPSELQTGNDRSDGKDGRDRDAGTQANDGSADSDSDAPRRPVERVSWLDALEFCRRLSNLPEERKLARAYRLPCEAEWEYACRAGQPHTDAVYRTSVWCGEKSGTPPHPVGSKRPNAWGFYDMLGNVSEWCSNRWSDDRFALPPAPGPGPEPNETRVTRGGYNAQGTMYSRPTYRTGYPANSHRLGVGFRVAFTQ